MSGAPPPVPGADDTIVALATPAGRGALAVVRMSGPAAEAIAARLVAPWPPAPRVAARCAVHDVAGRRLDEAVVTRYVAPKSFTGESMVEVSAHGGHAVPASILAALVEAGARLALPGEFTRRAVLNGKLDLLQAEAVGDLIDARSRGAQRVALQQLDGGLSRRILALRDDVLQLEALLAYDLDFPEEDDGPVPAARILGAADRALAALDALLAGARAGELVRAGALVVIAGAPNAGKSSLFNALLGRQRAIVTDVPGTTRDALEAVIDAGDGARWPLRLVDTAGLREAADAVERLGIEVSERYLAEADVVLACGESWARAAEAVAVCAARTRAPVVAVRTKGDVASAEDGGGPLAGTAAAVRVSAERGEGLGELLQVVERALDAATAAPPLDAPLLTHARHARAVRGARDEIARFRAAWHEGGLPAVVAAVHLRQAAHELEEMIGAVDVEEVLGRVFATFCVGK